MINLKLKGMKSFNLVIFKYMKKWLIVFSFFGGMFFSACSYRQVELIGIENVKIDKTSKSGVAATIFARINNPNNYKIRVSSNNLILKVGGVELGKAEISKKVALKRAVTDTYPISLELNYKNMAKGALRSLPSILLKQSVFTEVKGDLKGRVFLFSKKFPVNLNKRVNLVGNK